MNKIKILSKKEIDCVCGAINKKEKNRAVNNVEQRDFFLKSLLVMLGVPALLFFSYKFINWIIWSPVGCQYPRSRVELTALLEARLLKEKKIGA